MKLPKLKLRLRLPRRFTLREDWRDDGNADRSRRLCQAIFYLIILVIASAFTVFSNGTQFHELIGFPMVALGCIWSTGILKFEIIEAEKTVFNTIVLAALWLAGLLILFA